MKQCSNDCNQMLAGKRVREENRLPHTVKQSQNLFVVGCFVSRCRLCLTRCGSFQVVSCSL